MSQDQATYDTEIRYIAQSLMYNNLVTFAMPALILYEYMVTIDVEHKIVWQQKWTGMTWIFVMTRYLTVISAVLTSMGPSPSSCIATLWGTKFSLIILPLLLIAVFSALRVYAISGRSLWVTAPVLALNLVPVVINSWGLSRDTFGYVNDPVLGSNCIAIQSESPSLYFHLTLISRVALIFADIIVITVTWLETFSQLQLASRAGIASLSVALVRDGSIYFLALLGMNIGVVIVNSRPTVAYSNVASIVFGTLPPLLICRFLMNLRKASSPQNETNIGRFSRFSHPNFRVPTMDDIVGNLGEDLGHGPRSDHVEEAEELDEVHEEAIINGEDDDMILESHQDIDV